MTRSFLTTACALAVCATSLSACATPNYPISGGAAAAAPAPAPQYPVTAQAAPAPAPTAAPPSSPPPPAVESRSLPPVSGATAPPVSTPSAAPQSAPAQIAPAAGEPAAAEPPQTGLSPGYTPPSPTPAPSQPPPIPYAPPPEYRAPAVAYRPAPPRYVAGGKVVEARGMFRDYEVRKGDHVDAIARDLQTTRKVLVDANHLEAPFALQPGQHLKVPVAKAYEVQPGDTMAAVAKRFGVSAAELADLNDLPVRGRLRAGDRLALPDHIDDRGPTRLPTTMVERSAPYRAPSAVYRPSPASPTYSASAPASAPPEGGAYVPSAYALAAAQRLAEAKAYAAREAANPAAAGSRPYTPPRVTYSAPRPAPTPAAVVQAGQGRFLWPVRGEILSGFGATGLGRRNDGVDIKARQGEVVRAAAAGNVVYAGDQVPGFGNLVLIKHADGWVTAYAHLDSITVQMRQGVAQGQAIGEVGQSGGVAGPQLHFEVRYAATPADKAKPVDPILVLPK